MAVPAVHQAACHVHEVHFVPDHPPCPGCGRLTPRVWYADRTALDVALEGGGMVLVRVGVHRCDACRRHFRAQPPFLHPDSIYTHRVVDAAVQAVFGDGMAYVRLPERLARDFHVRPSEASIRRGCRAWAAGRTLDSDDTPWVVRSFSGVLCVDEVYQNRVALLLAGAPKAPEGDRLVGYQLLRDSVEQPDVEAVLTRLREAGITPQQVVTDDSALYPTVLAKICPKPLTNSACFTKRNR